MPAGPGALDVNGIWQYGEADTESQASDLLNLGQASTSTQLAADRVRLAALEAVSHSDIIIRPTTVVGGTLQPSGRVIFSGVASVSLQVLPTSSYELIKFILRTTAKGGSAGVCRAQLMVNATAETDANYSFLRSYQTGSTTTAPANATGQTLWELDAGSQVRSLIELDLASMGQAVATDGKVHATGAPTLYTTSGVVANSELVAYNGITFSFSSGTGTGWVEAYGIR